MQMRISDTTPLHTPEAPLEKPPLLSVEDAKALSRGAMLDLFAKHLNPGQLHFMTLLGFDKVKVERAEGMHYIDENGRKILDFFGGFGSLAFGHNHPRIIKARRRFAEEGRHEIAMAFASQYAAALAKNLAACSPGALDMVFLGSSGSEAMEAAVKLAERASGRTGVKTIYAQNAFHGKTKGVLSITDSPLYRGEFRLVENTVRVPFGDLAAIEAAVAADTDIGVIVLETIQGGGGIVGAPTAFWQGLRELCDRENIIFVADEVQCGLGRTGTFYAFQQHGIVPDITALAKSLGGGKCAMGAMIARRDIYMKAYGTPGTALIHGPATFGGMGEASITAIEALHILYDEDLMGNAARVGGHLIARLNALKARYPSIIKDVRGEGLMVGLELQDFSRTMPLALRPMLAVMDAKLKGSLAGFLGAA
ncbi:MAG: aminotransferase class III-fold pyridoxal phosphate-dependent enzyme, partial [Pseudomonadota bacterium]